MTIDERSRHELFGKLEEVLGTQHASVLMEHLPPVGWADVATKRDIDALAISMKKDIDALAISMKKDIDALAGRIDALGPNLENKLMAAFREELLKQTRTFMFTTVATTISLAGVFLVAVR